MILIRHWIRHLHRTILGAFGLAALYLTTQTHQRNRHSQSLSLSGFCASQTHDALSLLSRELHPLHRPIKPHRIPPIAYYARPINGYKPSPTALNWVLVYSYSAALFCSSSYSQPSPPRPSKPHAQTRRMLCGQNKNKRLILSLTGSQ